MFTPHTPPTDPLPKENGGCAQCGGSRPVPADPFCKTDCCRAYHNVPAPAPEPQGRTKGITRWTRKQERARHQAPRIKAQVVRTCKECGCPVDNYTSGCRTCLNRHAGRRYIARRRAGLTGQGEDAAKNTLVAGTSGRRALAHATDEE